MRTRRMVALGAGLAVAAAVGLAPGAGAQLGDGDTEVTFTLTNGTISLSTPSTSTLSTWASDFLLSGTSVSGTLPTTVTDERNSTAGWTVSAASTAFDDGGGNTIPASNVSIGVDSLAGVTQTVAGVTGALTAGLFVSIPGGTTGDVGGPIGQLVGAELVDALSLLGPLTGMNANNAIDFAPTVTVKVPPNTPDGTYTATITQTAS